MAKEYTATARLVSIEGKYHGPPKHLTVEAVPNRYGGLRINLLQGVYWESSEVKDYVEAVHILIGDIDMFPPMPIYLGPLGHPGDCISVDRM